LLYPNMTFGSLHLIGNHDDTKVKVYSLPDKSLLREFTANLLERQVVELSNGSFFKVVSDKPVTAMLIGGNWENVTAGVSTFHPSVEGGYVGKDFVLTTVESLIAHGANLPERVYALEDANVKVSNASGAVLKSFSLKANKVESLILPSLGLYRITSTGYIMVQTFNKGFLQVMAILSYYPAVEGGFVGRRFYGAAYYIAGAMVRRLIFMSGEDSKVAVFDLEGPRKVMDASVPAGKTVSITTEKLPDENLAFETDKPITMMFQGAETVGGTDGGVAYAGLKAGQTGYFLVPSVPVEGYIFAYEETVVDVDDVRLRVPADGFLTLTSGLHKITVDRNVLVQVIQLSSHADQGVTILDQFNFAVSIPSVQTMSITYPGLRLKPLGEELPSLYIGTGVAVVIAVALLVVGLRQRGKGNLQTARPHPAPGRLSRREHGGCPPSIPQQPSATQASQEPCESGLG